MASGVDFLELLDRDFRANGRGVELLVSEQLLDETDVGSAIKHVGRAGVTKQMARGRGLL